MICNSFGGGRLNTFQRLMLHWSEVYPYNATHTYKIAGPVRREELRAAIAETFWQSNLGIVELTARGRRFRHWADTEPPVQVIGGGQRPEARLTAYLTKELNRRFERPRCRPMRFGVVDAGPEAHYLSVTYDHWVADSATARMILATSSGVTAAWRCRRTTTADVLPGTYRDAFTSRLRGTGWVKAALRSWCAWAQQRLAGRPACPTAGPMDVRFEIHRVRPGTVERLVAFARSCQATVHDVILAALARAMAESLPSSAERRIKRGLGLGTIVDTRSDAEADLSRSLGMFLSYYLIRCRPHSHASLADLARQVAAMTRPVKSGRRYLDSFATMKLGDAAWGLLANWQKPQFARNMQPLDAGVTNVVVRNTWIDRRAAGHVLEYVRGASTGPTLPLVLSPTTLGDQLNLGVTYRVAAFSPKTIQGIVARFLDQIEQPEGAQCATRRSPIAAEATQTLPRAA